MKQIARAQEMSGLVWQVNQHRPEVKQDGTPLYPDSKIESIVRLGQYVEVFVRSRTNVNRGQRITLMPPMVSVVLAIVPATEWRESLNQVPEEDRLDEVTSVANANDMSSIVWSRGGPFPEGDPQPATIAAIADADDVDGAVNVFILPHPDHEFTRAGLAILVTLMPLTIQKMDKRDIPLDLYLRLQTEAAEAAEMGPEDPDEEEDEVADESTEPLARPQPTAVHGKSPMTIPGLDSLPKAAPVGPNGSSPATE